MHMCERAYFKVIFKPDLLIRLGLNRSANSLSANSTLESTSKSLSKISLEHVLLMRKCYINIWPFYHFKEATVYILLWHQNFTSNTYTSKHCAIAMSSRSSILRSLPTYQAHSLIVVMINTYYKTLMLSLMSWHTYQLFKRRWTTGSVKQVWNVSVEYLIT